METKLEKPDLTKEELEEIKRKLLALKGCCKGKSKMSLEKAREEAGMEAFAKYGLD
jgi:hypothetical protein